MISLRKKIPFLSRVFCSMFLEIPIMCMWKPAVLLLLANCVWSGILLRTSSLPPSSGFPK